jgi:hypothetical protein
MFHPGIATQESRLQPDQAFPAGCPVLAGIPPADEHCMFHPDSAAQESRLQPDQAFPAGCPVLAGIPPAKAGTPGYLYPDYFFNVHQPGLPDMTYPGH